MTAPDVILWLIVVAVGFPAMRWNPTAIALVLSFVASKAIYFTTGQNIAPEYYPFIDFFVITVILCRAEPCTHDRWSLWCLILERSPADKLVMLSFLPVWFFYVAKVSFSTQWFALWLLAIVQFLAAGGESLYKYRRASKAASAVPGTPSSGDEFRLEWGKAGYG